MYPSYRYSQERLSWMFPVSGLEAIYSTQVLPSRARSARTTRAGLSAIARPSGTSPRKSGYAPLATDSRVAASSTNG